MLTILLPRPIIHVIREAERAVQLDDDGVQVPSLDPTHRVEGHVGHQEGITWKSLDCIIPVPHLVSACLA